MKPVVVFRVASIAWQILSLIAKVSFAITLSISATASKVVNLLKALAKRVTVLEALRLTPKRKKA